MVGGKCGLSSRVAYRSGNQTFIYAPTPGKGKGQAYEADLATGTPTGAELKGNSDYFGVAACDAGYVMTCVPFSPDKRPWIQSKPDPSGFTRGAHYTIMSIPGLKEVGQGVLGNDPEGSEGAKRWDLRATQSIYWSWANPVFHNNRIYLNSMENIYCIGQ